MKRQRRITRLVVHRNGKLQALVKIDGVSSSPVLLPATTEDQYLSDRRARFTTAELAQEAIANTDHAGRLLREGVCSDFLKQKCPELAPLFDGGGASR